MFFPEGHCIIYLGGGAGKSVENTVEKRSLDFQQYIHSSPYTCSQTLGKAIKKVKCSLPNSPRKQFAIVSKIAKELKITTDSASTHKAHDSNGKKDHVKEMVTAFYNRDDISRMAPGVRDCITIRDENNQKIQLQKRHLMYSLMEAHKMFIDEHIGVKVGKSKFAQLRPVNVMLTGSMPHDVCLCRYHDNIKLLCDAINKIVRNFPTYNSNFVKNFVCSNESDKCMLGLCSKCPKWLDNFQSNVDCTEITTWYQWQLVDKIDDSVHSAGKRMNKVLNEGVASKMFDSLREQIPPFLNHVFIKHQQAKTFQHLKENMAYGHVVVQMDFSENYTCVHQDEIQSAHWHQQQVSLFTVATWINTEDSANCKCESTVITSNNLSHDKYAVAVFVDVFLKHCVKIHPEIKKVNFFTDGPSSQFKNIYF